MERKSYYLDDEQAKRLLKWHASLSKEHNADRAELRRCRTVNNLLCSRAFQRGRRLIWGGETESRLAFDQGRAMALGLCARVRTHDGSHKYSEQLGGKGRKDSEPPMSEARFQRILHTRSLDEFYTQMRRGVGLLRHVGNVSDLARLAMEWAVKRDDLPPDPGRPDTINPTGARPIRSIEPSR